MEHGAEKAMYAVLIMLYTSVRMSEFLPRTSIIIKKRYMTGGVKTDAKKDRVIPINEIIMPLLESHYNSNSKYFYPRKGGCTYSFGTFYNTNWKNVMTTMKTKHRLHDTKHTYATWLESVGVSEFHRKLNLGYTIKDITNGIYTHVSTETLIEDINQI